jgi:two-component system, sensor histidine kinase PdtaS
MRPFVPLAIFLASLPALVFGQSSADSLRILLKQARQGQNPAKILRALADLDWYFVNAKQYDSVLHYSRGALTEGDRMANPGVCASVFTNMGVAYSAVGQPDSSIGFYNKALALYTGEKDTINVVTIQTNLAIIYKNKGLYDKSLETSFSALSMLERRAPGRVLASCYNTIGVVYEKVNDYEDALTYYYKALNVRRQIGYLNGMGQSYNNIGEVYMNLSQYDSALVNFLRALDIKRSTRDQAAAASTLSNIGATLIGLGKPAQAEVYLRESLALEKESRDRDGMAVTLNSLAEAKLIIGDLPAAEAYLAEADPIIREAGALNELKVNLELKTKLYKQRKDYERAFQYAEALIVIKDSLLNSEKAEQLQNMQVRYETEKKEQQIALLEQSNRARMAEIEVKQFWIYGLAFAVLSIAIIGTLAYINLRIVRNHRRQLEILWKELNHRVKNNLQILSSIFTLQVQQQTDEAVLQAMKSGEGRVNAMALIHKKLYSDNESLDIKIKEYIGELMQYLIHSYGFDQKQLRLSVQVEEIHLDVDKVIRIGLIVNELVSNAFKYAYARQESPSLEVRISQSAKDIHVEVKDNGAGVPDGFDLESAQSFGLRMIRTFTRELRGKLAVHNQNGACFMLNIPIG